MNQLELALLAIGLIVVVSVLNGQGIAIHKIKHRRLLRLLLLLSHSWATAVVLMDVTSSFLATWASEMMRFLLRRGWLDTPGVVVSVAPFAIRKLVVFVCRREDSLLFGLVSIHKMR